LYGVRRIAAFLDLPLDVARHRVDDRTIPTFLLGSTPCAIKAALSAWLADLAAGADK
jgi:hypothetical protein